MLINTYAYSAIIIIFYIDNYEHNNLNVISPSNTHIYIYILVINYAII